jgi:hypothetical protein
MLNYQIGIFNPVCMGFRRFMEGLLPIFNSILAIFPSLIHLVSICHFLPSLITSQFFSIEFPQCNAGKQQAPKNDGEQREK